jgi:hypothetical protein
LPSVDFIEFPGSSFSAVTGSPHLQSAAVKPLSLLLISGALVGVALAQEAAPTKPAPPQVRVNYLNVCSPSDSEKAEISAALDRLPAKPRFAIDFEIARGRSSASEGAVTAGQNAKMSEDKASVSRWVRVRKEFPDGSPFSNVQYSFSVAEDKAAETLIFRLRDVKELLQVSISNSTTALANPAQVVAAKTPADRIRLERFGKSSLVLARCKESDQSAYEPLFSKASSLLNQYRELLGAKRVVPQDLPKPLESPVSGASKPAAKR